MKKLLLSITLFLALATISHAKDSTTCTGLLLKQTLDVRAMSMGGAFAAVETNASGANDYNPAGLAGNKKTDFSATYLSGLTDESFGALAFNTKLYDKWIIGSKLIYFDAGQMELVSLDGDSSNVTAQRDFVLSGMLSRRQPLLGSVLDLGINTKLLYSTLVDEYSALGIAFDLGCRYEIKPLLEGLVAGAAIKNIGPVMSYIESADELPGYALAGLTYNFQPIKSMKLLLAGDIQYDLEDKLQSHFGLEIELFNHLALRGGYRVGDDLGAMTIGLGVCMEQFELNYGFNLMEVVNSTHRINLVYTLKSKEFQKSKSEQVKEETIDDMLDSIDIASSVNQGPTEKVQVPVLEIRRKGGQACEVVLGVGVNHGMKENYHGTLYDSDNKPIAGITLTTVESELSLGRIQGLSKDMDNHIWAIIEKPKASESKQGGKQ